MRVIEPIETVLLTSNVPDDDIPAYNPDTTYSAGDRVIVAHSDARARQREEIYLALRSHNQGNYPPDSNEAVDAQRLFVEPQSSVAGFQKGEIVGGQGGSGVLTEVVGGAGGNLILHKVSGSFAGTDVITGAKSKAKATLKEVHTASLAAYWRREGVTNRWKMFDQFLHTQTENEETIDVTIKTDRCDHLVILDTYAVRLDITVSNNTEGETVFEKTWNLRLDASVCWSDYFFGPFLWKRAVTVPIPAYYKSTTHIVIHRNPGESVMCGHVMAGQARHLGPSQWGADVGITDYSRVYADDEGHTELRQGRWAKELSVDLQISTASVDALQRNLARYRAKPCIWDANNADTCHESLIVFGYYSDFNIVLPGPVMSTCNLTVQGLI